VVASPAPVAAAPVAAPPSASDTAFTAPRESLAPAAANAQASAAWPAPQLAAVASNGAPLRAAALCMNEQKANAVDDTIKGCDAVIDETQKSLANAYYFRASAKFNKKDLDGAIGDYGLAIKIYPNDPDYLNSRGAAFEAKNDLDHALADYDAVIKADPKAVYGYNSRGAAYQRKGDFARAAADYGEVTRLQPNNLDAWSARCWVRAITPNQAQLALGDCNTALKIKPDASDVLDTRGFIHLKLGQADAAIKDYDAALKLDPKLAGSMYGRGLAKMRKGDKNGGTADMAAAKTLRANIADEFARYGVKP
jgi:tetratricopeptide (TPR) repeat protein